MFLQKNNKTILWIYSLLSGVMNLSSVLIQYKENARDMVNKTVLLYMSKLEFLLTLSRLSKNFSTQQFEIFFLLSYFFFLQKIGFNISCKLFP